MCSRGNRGAGRWAQVWLPALAVWILPVLWGCGSADDLMHAWTGFRAGVTDTVDGADAGDIPGDAGRDSWTSDQGGTDPGVDPGVDPGTDPGVDSGTDPGVDPGTDPGTDPGVLECPRDKDCTGRVCGPDPNCGELCGVCAKWESCNGTGGCVGSGGCGFNCRAVARVYGSFTQGCIEEAEGACESAELPSREVTVSTFEIDLYEVTVERYRACVEAGQCQPPGESSIQSECNWGAAGRHDYPANCVTWGQASQFCSWDKRRLCRESEWEMAARGVESLPYPWGFEPATCGFAVIHEGGPGCGRGSPWPVGAISSGRSPFGLFDMVGNVWEWVEDDWHDSYVDAPTHGGAWLEEPRVSDRVVRGGSFASQEAKELRSTTRGRRDSQESLADVGFRCCRQPTYGYWYDTTSGLAWESPPRGGSRTWQDANNYCQNLQLAGVSWRMPTISELRSLVRGCPATEASGSCGVADDCLDYLTCRKVTCAGCELGAGPSEGCYKPSQLTVICNWCWSSSSAGAPDYAYRLNFATGGLDRRAKTEGYFVRCVHDGEL